MRKVALSPRDIARFERHALARRLLRINELEIEDLEALSSIPVAVRLIAAGQDIARDGDTPSVSFMTLDGFTLRYKRFSDKAQRILSLHQPGYFPDLQSLYLKKIDHNIGSLSAAKIGFVRHQDLRRICLHHPRISAVLWRETAIQATIGREWLVRLGRLDGLRRIAHFLCEIYMRLKTAGQASALSMQLPFTQHQVGQVLGLTDISVNRTLAKLRSDGLLRSRGKHFDLLDWDHLATLGEFTPSYLHLDRFAAA